MMHVLCRILKANSVYANCFKQIYYRLDPASFPTQGKDLSSPFLLLRFARARMSRASPNHAFLAQRGLNSQTISSPLLVDRTSILLGNAILGEAGRLKHTQISQLWEGLCVMGRFIAPRVDMARFNLREVCSQNRRNVLHIETLLWWCQVSILLRVW